MPNLETGLVSQRVLVESFLPGQTMSSLLLADAQAAEAEAGALAEAEEAAAAAMQAVAMGALTAAEANAAVAAAAECEAKVRRRVERNAELARLGLRTFLTMLLRHNFVHADLHPGNILVTTTAAGGGDGGGGEGAAEEALIGSPCLGIVDAGLVVQLSARDRRNFLLLFRAIGRGDGEVSISNPTSPPLHSLCFPQLPTTPHHSPPLSPLPAL